MRWAGWLVGPWLIVVACSAPGPLPPSQSAGALSTPSPEATAVVVQVSQSGSAAAAGKPASAAGQAVQALPSPVALPLAVLAGRSGGDVRVALERLLQEQVFLTALAMNAASNARLDEQIGVSSALDQSSLTLAEVVGAVKGQPTAVALIDAWRGQSSDFIQLSGAQRSAAMADLDRRRATIAAQLATGELSSEQVDDLLRANAEAQLAIADAVVAHDAAQFARAVRKASAASDDLARPLANALAAQVPSQVTAPTEGLDVDLRLAINHLLQDHLWLTAAAAASGADSRTADQEALAAAADAASTELGQQIAATWGADLGSTVADRLRRESAALIAAAAGGDRAQSATDVERLRTELDALLATANPLLPRGFLAQQLRASDQPLLTAGDAFVVHDFGTAYSRLREAARLAQKPADSLALSIVDRFPRRFLTLPAASSDVPVTPADPPR